MSDDPKATQPSSDTDDDTEGHMHTYLGPDQGLADKGSSATSSDGDDGDDDVEGHMHTFQ